MSGFTFVISDIHGRLDLLDACLAAIARHSNAGRVIFTGDYIDRGPDSRGVIQRLMDGPPPGWDWRFIRGNHEDFLLDAVRGGDPSSWLANGGMDCLKSYGMELEATHVAFMDKMPRLIWDDLRVYTHAGVQESLPLDQQPEAITQWFRYPPKADVGYNGRHVVHGHTPQVNGPELYPNRTNLDVGGVFTGRMAVGVFDSNQGQPIDIIHVKGNRQ